MEAPIYISATGPDGAGKDTAWRNAKPLLPTEITLVKIGKPSSIIKDGIETYVHAGMSRALDAFHGWADVQRSRKLTLLSNTLYVMFQWKVQEPLLISQVKPDVVFSLRDGYVDPAAYAPYYSAESLGRLDIPQRIDTLRRLHGSPYRDHTIFMDVNPKEAVKRINERLHREANLKGLIRPKWVHQHENQADLQMIRDEYFKVLAHMEKFRGTQVSYLDTNSASRSQIGTAVANVILKAFDHLNSRVLIPT